MRRILRALVILFLTSASVPIAVAVTILGAFLFLPLPATLPEARVNIASRVSRIYAADGTEIGIFREFEQNIPVEPADIPEHLKKAVISAEDRNFYRHGGVDIRGSARALWADIRNREIVQGGSTITQQYVKNVYTSKERSLSRKVREAILASQLDRQVDKEEILFKYLSSIYLGEGAYGVGAASETYFRKPVSGLTLSEAALLAALIPAPSRFNPRADPGAAEIRRKRVLATMLSEGHIDQAAHDAALAEVVWPAAQGAPPGPATVIHPPVQTETRFPYFVDYLKRYLIDKYGPAKVFRGGLKIQTTLDIELQNAADKTHASALKGVPDPIDMSIVAVEPPTGYVKAMVGGRSFDASQVNLALGKCPSYPPETEVIVEAACHDEDTVVVEGGGSGRQPGSSWKPFVLAAAYAKGIQPSRVYPAPNSYRYPGCTAAKGCTIGNYEGASFGSSDLKRAMAKSINTVFAQLIRDVGVKETAEMAKKLGITSAWYGEGKFGQGLSYSLGVQEVSPLEMASAFGVFANRGVRAKPTPVFKILEPDGKALEDNSKALEKADRVLDEVIADNVTDALRGVITGGTGTRANIGRPAAGKTGTTNDFKDAWFVGYTPTLSAAVWMGHRATPTPMRGIKGNRSVAGGTIPAATWKIFMDQALKDVPVTEFSEPAPIKAISDELKRQARRGIDPGTRRDVGSTGSGGPYEFGPAAPKAVAPSTTTTTAPPTPRDRPGSTTTTTVDDGIIIGGPGT